MENRNSILNGLLLFAAGAVVGSVVAVLYAKQTGKETREQLKELTDETKDKISEFMKKGEALFDKGKGV